MTTIDKTIGFRVALISISPTVSTEGARPPQGGLCFFLVHFNKKIRTFALAQCQFPLTLTDQHGTFHKPAAW